MCRFGKSYLIKYLIDYFEWKDNDLLITTKPNETFN